jgi:hypothetical protein
MEKQTYNGWTNYATWRVNLEIFDGMNPSDYWVMDDDNLTPYELGKSLKEYAEDIVCMDIPEGLAMDYVLAFLSDVDWYSIAKHMIEAHLENSKVEA